MSHVGNRSNVYVAALPEGFFDSAPKTVIAAIAYSLALRLYDDNHDAASAELIREWYTLHVAGIVPQRPVVKP